MMIVGVTGSRHARPDFTVDQARQHLIRLKATEMHHGDCVGWDEQMHNLASAMGIKTVSHPPTSGALRANCGADIILAPLPFLDRNKAIVSAVDFLIAAPDRPEEMRSGTWSTVRYAKKCGVKGVVLSGIKGLELKNWHHDNASLDGVLDTDNAEGRT
jgi:hypothetical protein